MKIGKINFTKNIILRRTKTMVKHGFVLGWVFAWFLIGYWKMFVEDKLSIWWSIAFFVAGLFLGTLVQTLMDRAEEKRKIKEQVVTEATVHKY